MSRFSITYLTIELPYNSYMLPFFTFKSYICLNWLFQFYIFSSITHPSPIWQPLLGCCSCGLNNIYFFSYMAVNYPTWQFLIKKINTLSSPCVSPSSPTPHLCNPFSIFSSPPHVALSLFPPPLDMVLSFSPPSLLC